MAEYKTNTDEGTALKNVLDTIKNNIINAYKSITEKNGTYSGDQNATNLAAAINTIPTSTESEAKEDLVTLCNYANEINTGALSDE